MSSASGVVIREATPDDARAIAEVHVASWRWAYRDDLPADVPGRAHGGRPGARVERVAHARRCDAGTLVAVPRTASSSGFCSFGPSRDDDADGRTAEVLTIYLLEDVVGRGIGRELFASANDRLRELGYRRATLWVMASNERSRRFYERAGWSWDGTTSAHRFDCGERPDRPVRGRPVTAANPYRVRIVTIEHVSERKEVDPVVRR